MNTDRRGKLRNRHARRLLIETVTHLVLVSASSPAVALDTMLMFGADAYVWNTTATLIRQRAVPDAFLGRVTGVYMVGVFGGMVVGTPIGGLPGRQLGITAPFWFGVIGSAAAGGDPWRQFDHVAHPATWRGPHRPCATWPRSSSPGSRPTSSSSPSCR